MKEKSIKIAERLNEIVDAKEKQKAESIEAMKASMKKDRNSFDEMESSLKSAEELMVGVCNEKTKQIKSFEEGVRKGTPQDVAHAKFVTKVNDCTRDTLQRQRDVIRSAFIKWAENQKNVSNVEKFVTNIGDIPLCEKQGLSEEEYDWMRDPNVYYTNDYLLGVLLGGAGGAIAGVAGVGKCFSYMYTLQI